MSGRLTLWGAGQLLTTYFSGETDRLPSLYLALIKDVPPTPYVSGDELDEPVGMSYQRVEIPMDAGYWHNDVQPQLIATDQDLEFVAATGDWGRIKYWALCDSMSAGNCFAVGAMEDIQEITDTDTAVVSSGDISISLGPFLSDGS